MGRTITVLMDLPPEADSHRFTVAALRHATAGTDIAFEVVRTDAVGRVGAAVIIGPGSPYRDPAAAEEVIEVARREGIPLVGT